jgi:hypothetical protein
MTGREAQRDELRIRARQQEVIAGLGQRALAGMKLGHLLYEAATTAARELGTEYAAVLELTRDGRGLLVRAAHGLPEGMLGEVIPVIADELPGFALGAAGPVVVAEARSRARRALRRRAEAAPATTMLGP